MARRGPAWLGKAWLGKAGEAGANASSRRPQTEDAMKSDRELMSQAFRDGKIAAWWRDRHRKGFCVLLPDGRIGRIRVARVEEVLATLPAGKVKARTRVFERERGYVDL